MSQKIFLKYDGEPLRYSWANLSSDGRLLRSGDSTPLEELKHLLDFDNADTYLFIATPDIVVREIDIPEKIPFPKIKRALPSLLEEESLSSLEELHSTFKQVQKGKLQIATISRNLMMQMIEALRSVHIIPLSISPLFLAFNLEEEAVVWFDKKYTFWQLSFFNGFCVDRGQFSEYLGFSKNLLKDKILHVVGHLTDDEKSKLESQVKKMHLETQDVHWSSLINENQNQLNLLVEPFALRKTNGWDGNIKKHLIVFATVAPALLLTFFLTQFYKLDKLNETFNNQITAIYSKLYPKAQSVTSPRQRIEQELKTLSTASKGDFFHLLYYVGEQAKSIKNLEITNLSFHNSELRVGLEVDHYTTIDKMMKEFKDSNYEVEQRNTTTEKDKVKSTLIVKRKRSA